MLYKFIKLTTFFAFLLLTSCKNATKNITIKVDNQTDTSRTSESVEIWLNQLNKDLTTNNNLEIFDASGKIINSQKVDLNNDSITDYILFQTDIKAKGTKFFTLKTDISVKTKEKQLKSTFCRLVPERMDDFAWENDKVAFRTYGPKCQYLFENGNAGGLISSGIDCWLKRVDYPIINKWYKNHQSGKSYHTDHGEGLDNYHVGTTRGCGGIALWCNEKSYFSQNFTKSKVITNGPIRSIFELEYNSFDVCGNAVKETKRISIDLGENFYKCDVSYVSDKQLETASTGITLHNGKGTINANLKEGWISYWEPMGDSFLGTAVFMNPKLIAGSKLDSTIYKDESLNNIYLKSKLTNNKFSYWSGFGWKKRGEFNNNKEWNSYLSSVTYLKQNPLKIEIIKN